VSKSIANFKDKLEKRLELHDRFTFFGNTIFIGLYHQVDYLRFIVNRGEKKVFWCGSDILALREHTLWRFVIKHIQAKYYCENDLERLTLEDLGITAEITPMIFDDPDKYQVCYKHSDNPRVFATYHKGREEEYAVYLYPQVHWFCDLSEEEFNEKIKSYQGCIRLNRFDGFAESLAKSLLLGQYQWSEISYPYMTTTQSLYQWLSDLKNKKEPNPASQWWREHLEDSKRILLA